VEELERYWLREKEREIDKKRIRGSSRQKKNAREIKLTRVNRGRMSM